MAVATAAGAFVACNYKGFHILLGLFLKYSKIYVFVGLELYILTYTFLKNWSSSLSFGASIN